MRSEHEARASMKERRAGKARLRAVIPTLLLAAMTAPGASAGDGVQFSGDCDRTYVNKQVGETEQWAITWEIYGNATGNVFKLDGTDPSFLECILVDEDETNEIFDCYGSAACAEPTCGGTQWSLIASEVSVPLAFFLPPDVDPQNPFEQCEVRE
jgi:hypothetical protein